MKRITPNELVEYLKNQGLEAESHSKWIDLSDYRKLAEARIDVGRAEAYFDAAQRLQDSLEGVTIVIWRGIQPDDIVVDAT